MSEQMDLSNSLEDIDEELNDQNNQMETKIVFKKISAKTDRQISEEELYSLYHSFDINFDELNRRYSLWRLDVIHIRGVKTMSSEDVLKYFDDFEPNSIEWVNDLSCNVVFADRKASAIAMRALTTSLVLKANKDCLNCDLGIDVVDADSLSVPVPPGRWRLGLTHPKSSALLLRFATNSDKKIRGSRGMSEYYAKHGIPSDNGSNGSANQRKRHYIRDDMEVENDSTQDSTDSMIEFKTKRLRMRMRADDEQELIRKRLIHRIGSVEGVGNDSTQKKSIWERLDHSFDNYCAVDTELLQIAFDNETHSRKSVWKGRHQQPMRSSISVVKSDKNVFFDRNDLRTKIGKRKSY